MRKAHRWKFAPVGMFFTAAISVVSPPGHANEACIEAPTSQCIFQIALDETLAPKARIFENHSLLKTIAEHQAKARRYDEALKTALLIKFDVAKESCLRRLGEIAALAGDLSDALRFADQAGQARDDAREKSRALSQIAVALAQRGDLDAGLRLAHSIEDTFDRSSAYVWIARTVVRSGEFEHATKIVSLIEGSDRQIHARSDIAEVWARHDRVIALQEFENLLRLIKTAKGEFENGERLFADVVQYMARAGFVSEANREFDNLSTLPQRDDLLSNIATSLAKQGEIEEAFTTIARMQNDTWRDRAAASITWAVAETGDYSAALDLAKGLSDREEIYDRTILRIADLVLRRHGAGEQFDAAMALIKAKDNRARAMASKARFLTRAGRLEEARRYAVDISPFFGWFDLRAEFAIAEARRGNISSALREAMNLKPDGQPVRKALSEGERIRALSEIALQLAVSEQN